MTSQREPVIHDLRVWHQFFEDIRLGLKTFEVRRENGRLFQVEDILRLNETEGPEDVVKYTGRTIYRRVVYICRGPFPEAGLPEGSVVLGLK